MNSHPLSAHILLLCEATMQLAGRSRQRTATQACGSRDLDRPALPSCWMLQSGKQRGSGEDVERVKKGYRETVTLYTVGKNSNGVEVLQK